jgi:hypothetical protein
MGKPYLFNYTACHKNIPIKGWRHKCRSKKTPRNRNVFLTTTIEPLIAGFIDYQSVALSKRYFC